MTKAQRSPRAVLSVLLIGAFMALLDTTIVNVALPTIEQSLGANNATLEWVISGYALTFGLTLIPAGRLGDRFGHSRIFAIGVALFTLASLACGVATTPGFIVAARIAQGLAGGMYYPAITALIQLTYSGRDRGKAFAVLGMVIGASTALGPLIGGGIIEVFGTDHGWRYIFGVNVPIGIAAVVAAQRILPGPPATVRARTRYARSALAMMDLPGLTLLTLGICGILVPLIEGQTAGWPWWTFAVLALGVVVLLAFRAWELAVERKGGAPIVPPHLFRSKEFSAGVLLVGVYFAAFTSVFL